MWALKHSAMTSIRQRWLRAGDRERRISRQQFLPGDGIHAIEEIVEGHCLIVRQQEHDALHRAQIQVGGSDHFRAAGEEFWPLILTLVLSGYWIQ